MKTEEKVTIVLDSKRAVDPPIKFCKARNGRPSSSRFKFLPKNFTQLAEFVEHITWLSAEKKFFLRIAETPRMEVLQWLEFVENQYVEIQKSPFVDLDTNAASLMILDDCDKEVATIKIKNLKLEEHHCAWHKLKADAVNNDTLMHDITVSYQYASTVIHATKEKDVLDKPDSDDEWQTMETP